MNQQALSKLRKARSAVLQGYPLFGSLLLKQKLVEAVTLPGGSPNKTMATDGKHIYYNPDFVLGVSMEELHFVVAHEACHPAFLHHTRRGDRDPDRWNQAGDYAINSVLKQAGLPVPDYALYDPQYTGMSTDRIYGMLPEPPKGDDGKGNGNGSGEPDTSMPGAVIDAPCDTPEEVREEEHDWQVAMTQAANFAPAGSVPSETLEEIRGLAKPAVNWRERLQQFMQDLARKDYSWARQNRRYIAQGMYLPALKSEELPPILFVVDASGSMPQDKLRQAVSEIQVVLDDLQPEFVDVIAHDTSVTQVGRYEVGDIIEAKIPTGGGTKFAPATEWIAQADEQYAAVIWFTDLMTNDWSRCEIPDIPLIWIDYYGGCKPQFGDEHVVIEEEA